MEKRFDVLKNIPPEKTKKMWSQRLPFWRLYKSFSEKPREEKWEPKIVYSLSQPQFFDDNDDYALYLLYVVLSVLELVPSRQLHVQS